MRIISPSMLSADFGNLERDLKMLETSRAEWIHIDVMDGVFVPNISFGFPIIKAIRSLSSKFLDVHLMIVEPERYVERMAKEGAQLITYHYEAVSDHKAIIEQIHRSGAKAGVSLKPATDVEVLRELLPMLDLVLIMSVEPGFGGQKYIEESTAKVQRLREIITEVGTECLIEVDGGVGAERASELFSVGANVLVAGSAVFGAADPQQAIINMLNA